MAMDSERYIRQTVLKDFGLEAQQKLFDASVLVVGAGGLGVPVLQYLNAMGVGSIGIIDHDTVSLSNLHRQVLYNENDIRKSKVTTALEKLKLQNSTTNLQGYDSFLTKENALDIINEYDVVVDASDNFATRYLVNDACVILGKPFIYGALHDFEGHVSVFNHQEGPTYRCLFPKEPKAHEIPNCNEQGVLGVLPGIIGSIQALETVKTITHTGTPLSGILLVFDGLDHSHHKFNITLEPKNKKLQRLKDSYELECTLEAASITTEEFQKRSQNSESIQLIDVRTQGEFAEFHLNEAVNIPLDMLEENHQSVDATKPIYLICQSGVRSLKATQLLKTKYPSAELITIEGGLNQLKHDGSSS